MKIVHAAIAALGVAMLAGSMAGCSPAESQATVDRLSWSNPTTRTDGSALTNLASIRIQWGASVSGPFNEGETVVPFDVGQPVEIARPNVPGTRCYVAVAIDADGLESAPSNAACKTITAPPSAVTNLTVE